MFGCSSSARRWPSTTTSERPSSSIGWLRELQDQVAAQARDGRPERPEPGPIWETARRPGTCQSPPESAPPPGRPVCFPQDRRGWALHSTRAAWPRAGLAWTFLGIADRPRRANGRATWFPDRDRWSPDSIGLSPGRSSGLPPARTSACRAGRGSRGSRADAREQFRSRLAGKQDQELMFLEAANRWAHPPVPPRERRTAFAPLSRHERRRRRRSWPRSPARRR